jgi:predicted membrane protein
MTFDDVTTRRIQQNENTFELNQGDQIVLIFAYCVFVYFGQFFRNSRNLWATFSTVKIHAQILTNIVLGYILGEFVTDSSGHPELN